MIVSYDPLVGATYVELLVERAVARTVSVSDLVMVDLDANGEPVGVEFAVFPGQITAQMLDRVAERFPTLKELRYSEHWLLTAAR